MKIVHLTSAHDRNDTRIFVKMCKSLLAHGFDVHLVVADGKGDDICQGVHIHDVGKTVSGRINRMTKAVSLVFHKAKELNADLYHLHDPELLQISLKLKRLDKTVIFDAHEDLPLQVLSKPYLNPIVANIISKVVSKYEQYICKRLDAVIAATPYIRDKFSKINPNSIDINNFPILDELADLDTSDFPLRDKFCYVGTITKVRGIEGIVHSLELTHEDFKLNLAGEFSESSLEDSVKKLKGWEKVIDNGWLDRAGIQSVLNSSFAGIVTLHPIINYQDSLPVKMFEYMAAGLPVIYSNISYWESIIEPESCGLSVDPFSPSEISNAVNYLGSNLDVAAKMGQKGREAVFSKYNWTIEERKLISLYRNLLKS